MVEHTQPLVIDGVPWFGEEDCMFIHSSVPFDQARLVLGMEACCGRGRRNIVRHGGIAVTVTQTSDRLLTLEEYERLPDDGYRDELVRGRLVREPLPGGIHDWVATNLFRSLDRYAEQHSLGHVAFDTGFLLSRDPPTVRGPDVAFLAWERIPPEGPPKGFWETAPDLAVEVLSPSNTAAAINDKVLEYLGAGTRLVWVVDPETRCATVYRSQEDVRVLTMDDILGGDDVLPGFRLPLSQIFDLRVGSAGEEAENP